MRNRAAALMLTALGLVAGATGHAGPWDLMATGTVVSKSADTLVIRLHEHGHRISFGIGSASLPEGVTRGKHVRVEYHATGATGQAADRVTLLPGPPAGR